MEGNRSSGWELQKENIQPLSSGRKVNLLKHSLETSMRNMTDYEEETDLQVKVLEERTRSYKGEDPIEPWLELITYLENSCVLVAKLKMKLNLVLKTCTRLFLQAPQYKNDKRFLAVYSKSMADLEPLKRIQIHEVHLKMGVGTKCSLLYLEMAELEESIGKPLDAVKSLKKGIMEEAQPVEQIKDALIQLEYRVAQRLAKSVLSEEGIAAAAADARNFGTSVPVYGPSNEAPAFRTDLQPAIPVLSSKTVSQPRQKLTEIDVFPCGTGIGDNIFPRSNEVNPLLVVAEAAQHDEENKPDPSKWNQPAVALESESTRAYVETSRERMRYSSEEHSVSTSKASTVQKGVLRERKDAAVDVRDDVSDTSCNVFRQGPLKMMCRREFYPVREKEVSFEQRARDRWLKLEAQKTGELQQLGSEVQRLKTALSKKEEELIVRQEERNRMESKLKTKISECQELAQELERQKQGNQKLISECQEFAQGLERQKQGNQKLISELARKETYVAGIEKSKTKLEYSLSQAKIQVEELVSSLSQMKARNEELSALVSQQQAIIENSRASSSSSGPSSNECTFVPRPSNQTTKGNGGGRTLAVDPTTSEKSMFETTSFQNFSRADVSDVDLPPAFPNPELSHFLPPPMAAKKMAFTLYESHLESFSNAPRGAQAHGNGTMSQNRILPINDENQNKVDFQKLSENIPPPSEQSMCMEHLPSHTILETDEDDSKPPVRRQTLRNVTPPRSTPIYAENLDETEISEPLQGGGFPDFNLTNLTRALEFRPEPLLNSTPERNSGGYDPRYENVNSENYIQTTRIPHISRHHQLLSQRDDAEFDIEGPLSPVIRERLRIDLYRTSEPEPEMANNLSPIQETSKENRSNCTTGSSSGNMTSTRGTSGTSLYNSTQSTRSGGPPSRYQYQSNYH